jgi:ubiquinone/menaquinone biosynthesis C-methylase UbiE
MDEQQRTTKIKETFNTVSTGYDKKALRFFPDSARHMATLLGLLGDEQVLDVACGTGNAALAIAPFLSRGKVTAVDFSSGMLEQARQKADAQGIRNVEFLERDMQSLGFRDRFDVAVCAFGIFFVEDMDAQLARIASAVKPGGRIMISNFQDGYMQPLRDMLVSRIMSYGVKTPPQTWKLIAHEAGCRELFEKAGFMHVTVDRKNIGYHLSGAEEWWDIVWNAGFRGMVTQLDSVAQERFKQEHLQEVDALKTDKGIWLDVGVLYTGGTKGRSTGFD